MPIMIDYLKESFISLYETNFKGKDKYARFLVAWHENLSHIAVAGCKTADDIWFQLVDGCEDQGEASDRSAILTAVAKGVYEILNENQLQVLPVIHKLKNLYLMMTHP